MEIIYYHACTFLWKPYSFDEIRSETTKAISINRFFLVMVDNETFLIPCLLKKMWNFINFKCYSQCTFECLKYLEIKKWGMIDENIVFQLFFAV